MEVLLLGAGASVEAGIPSAYSMSKKIVMQLRGNRNFQRESHALSYVVGGMLFDIGKKNRNPFEPELNVEDLFNAVQFLADRSKLEASPFIGTWDSFIDELDISYPRRSGGNIQRTIIEAVGKELKEAFSQTDIVSNKTMIDSLIDKRIKKNLEHVLQKKSANFSGSESIGEQIEKALLNASKKWKEKMGRINGYENDKIRNDINREISASSPVPGDGRVFHETNKLMIAALKDLVWITNPKMVSYLSPLLNCLSRDSKLVIATLNYDNTIELMSQSYNIECNSGISEWSQTGEFNFSSPGINLIKLHGSIDWEKIDSAENGKLPMSGFRQISQDEMKKRDHKPAVIFGSKNKLTADGPFLELLRSFAKQLELANELTIVGYSFNDPHINVTISQWFNSNTNHSITIINGKGFEGFVVENKDPSEFVYKLVELSHSNGSRVFIADEFAGKAFQDKFGTYRSTAVNLPESTIKSAMSEMSESYIDNVE